MKVRHTQNLRQNRKTCNYFRKMAVALNLFSFAKVHRPMHIQEQSYNTECLLHIIRKWRLKWLVKQLQQEWWVGEKRSIQWKENDFGVTMPAYTHKLCVQFLFHLQIVLSSVYLISVTQYSICQMRIKPHIYFTSHFPQLWHSSIWE